MNVISSNFTRGFQTRNGYILASAITPYPAETDPALLRQFYSECSETDLRYATLWNHNVDLDKAEKAAWFDVLVAFWKAAGAIIAAEDATNQGSGYNLQWNKAYDAWKEVLNALIKGYSSASACFEAWTVPCLYVAGKYLRTFAIQADKHAPKVQNGIGFQAELQDDVAESMEENEKLKDAARQINRIFSLCVSDRKVPRLPLGYQRGILTAHRAPIEDSRKWALYYTTNLLFKTYFKLNSISLSKNILRSLQASTTDTPPLHAFPRAHIVTFQYYAGVIAFLEEDYAKAESLLTEALHLCHVASTKNRSLILTYLIPCRLITTNTLPTPSLLSPFPHLQRLFSPLCTCIKRGDLAGFDAALAAGMSEFVKRRIYLTLERGRDVALRNLFRKVFVAGGWVEEAAGRVRRTRVPVAEFAAALAVGMGRQGGEGVERDEVECLIANLIYKGFMKGYISRERATVVLSKGGAFPGTGV